MRAQLEKLVALGPPPAEGAASVEHLQELETLLLSIVPPVTCDEAASLVTLFGDDECFSLAWTLIHLIETSPGWPDEECLAGSGNQWIALLKQRLANAD